MIKTPDPIQSTSNENRTVGINAGNETVESESAAVSGLESELDSDVKTKPGQASKPKWIKTPDLIPSTSKENGAVGINVCNKTFESELGVISGSECDLDSDVKTKPKSSSAELEASKTKPTPNDSDYKRQICDYCGDSISQYVL